jgi:hypothetical protein
VCPKVCVNFETPPEISCRILEGLGNSAIATASFFIQLELSQYALYYGILGPYMECFSSFLVCAD